MSTLAETNNPQRPSRSASMSSRAWLWFLFVAGTFWLLDGFSLSLGDDFGYMFADSANHAADGLRVSSFSDAVNAQAHQYLTTNGRFAVHVTVMSMLSLVPLWLYRLLNALVFGLLWLFTFRLGFGRIRGWFAPTATLCMIWWLIPDAGTIMLSLVSYSVNYMWTATAVLALLLLAPQCKDIKRGSFAALALFALLCGSLQESFSLPLSVAIVIDSIIGFHKLTRRQFILRILFLIGSAAVIAAPGNFVHFNSGGAFASSSLQHKLISMLGAVAFSSISILAAILLIWPFVSRKNCIGFIVRNRLLLIAIATAILFAAFTFTAPRQLFAPSLFAVILLCRIVRRNLHSIRKILVPLTSLLLAAWIAFFAGALLLRREVKYNYLRFFDAVSSAKSEIIFGDASLSPYNTRPLLWKILGDYAPDPWERAHFSLPFDAYSRRGISRLIFGDNQKDAIKTVLPYSPDYLLSKLPVLSENAEEKYTVTPIDSRYSTVAIATTPPRKIYTDAPDRRHYEQFYGSDGIVVILVPEYVKTIQLSHE